MNKRINHIIEILSFNFDNLVFFQDKKQNLLFLSKNIKTALFKITPYAVGLQKDKPFILFLTEPIIKKQIFQLIWNIEIPIIINDNGKDITIYNGLNYIQKINEFEKLYTKVFAFIFTRLLDSCSFLLKT